MSSELEKLQELLEMGFIHEEEFQRRKADLGLSSSGQSNTSGISNPQDSYSTYSSPSDSYTSPSTSYNTSSDPYTSTYNSYNTSSDPYTSSYNTYSSPSDSYISTSYNTSSDLYSSTYNSYNPPSDPYSSTYNSYNPPSDPYSSTYNSYNPPSDPYSSTYNSYNPPSDPYSSTYNSYNPPSDPYSSTYNPTSDPYTSTYNPTSDPYTSTYNPYNPPSDPYNPYTSTYNSNDNSLTPNLNNLHPDSQNSVTSNDNVSNSNLTSAPSNNSNTILSDPENVKDNYVVYGKDVNGIVIYRSTRSGTVQSPLQPQPFYYSSLFGNFDLPNIQKTAVYYLQNIFDRKNIYDDTFKKAIPNGQYYLKERRSFFVRSNLIGCDSLMLSSFHSFIPDASLNPYHLPVLSFEVVDSTSYAFHGSYDAIYGHNTKPGNTAITVRDGTYIAYFPASTSLRTIRTDLRARSSTLQGVMFSKRTYKADEDIPEPGHYHLIRSYQTTQRGEVIFRLYDHELPTKEKPRKYIPIQRKREILNESPQELLKGIFTSEELQARLLTYAKKPTQSIYLRLHFFERTRFLQKKNNTLGSITERLENNLCIVSGKPVSIGEIMDKDHFDEVLNNICTDMKAKNLWSDLVPEKVSQNEGLTLTPKEPDMDKIPQKDFPVLRSGDVFNKGKEKFYYVTPLNFQNEIQGFNFKKEALRNKVLAMMNM